MNFVSVFCETDCWRILFKHLTTASLIALRKTCKAIRVRTRSYSTYAHAINIMPEPSMIVTGLPCLNMLNGDYDDWNLYECSLISRCCRDEFNFCDIYRRPHNQLDTTKLHCSHDYKILIGYDIWKNPEAFVDSLDLEFAHCFLGNGKLYVSSIDAVVKKEARLDVTRHYLRQRFQKDYHFLLFLEDIYCRLDMFLARGYRIKLYNEIPTKVHALAVMLEEKTQKTFEVCNLMAYIWVSFWNIRIDERGYLKRVKRGVRSDVSFEMLHSE